MASAVYNISASKKKMRILSTDTPFERPLVLRIDARTYPPHTVYTYTHIYIYLFTHGYKLCPIKITLL